jgi:uncharacterized protein involved in exopolysaccharide biosynthesis
MNIIKFIEILIERSKYLIILPLVAGVLTFFLTKNLHNQYSTEVTIYTGITSNTGLDVNVTRVDKIITQNEYNNVFSIFKSEAIYEEISLRLLAQHLVLNKPQKDIISEKAFNELQKSVPDKIKKLVVKGNIEKTYENLSKSVIEDDKNFLYRILNYGNPYYGINALQNLKVEQINSSDMLKLSYQCDDQGICYNTTKIAAEVFIKQYGEMKKTIKSSAVKYFQKKLEEISKELETSEDNLLKFNVSNDIINYYEQTKQVTTQNEEIELRLQEAKMSYEASLEVEKKIEKEISKRYVFNLRNIEILNIRTQLVNCQTAIAQNQIYKTESSTDISNLVKRKINLEKRLQNCVDSLYNFNSNSQGIESQRLLTSWLDAVTNYETFNARYQSMKKRRAEFQIEFKRYAPLGAITKRIEREINVHEGEYLNVLKSLNDALQNEQNINMISNMRITDPAKFPIIAISSKKKLYVIIAMLFTLIFYILGLFIVELLDHRIKTPALLNSLTKLDLLSAFCLHNNKKFNDTEQITHKAAIFIYEKIMTLSTTGRKPFVIQILSNWDRAGKTFVSKIIEEELLKRDFKVANLNFTQTNSGKELEVDNASLPVNQVLSNYYKSKTYAELLGSEYENLDYIISVIQSVSHGIDNTILIKDADLNLIVFNADLTWSEADQFNLNKINELIQKDTYTILTNAQPNNLEELYGEIPKKRSKFRVMIKKMLKRFTK